LEPIEKFRWENQNPSDERAVAELGYQRENIIGLAFMDPIGRAVSLQSSVWREQPQSRLGRVVEFRKFSDQPFERKQAMEPIGLRLRSAGLPSRHRLRRRIEQLGDISRFHPSPIPDGLEPCRYRTSHGVLL
jgi:hypothetical protein